MLRGSIAANVMLRVIMADVPERELGKIDAAIDVLTAALKNQLS